MFLPRQILNYVLYVFPLQMIYEGIFFVCLFVCLFGFVEYTYFAFVVILVPPN